MQRTIHFFESSHFCSIHANLLYSHLATQLLLLLLWSLLRRACSRETSGCLLQRTLWLTRLHTHSIDIRYTLPVIASYVPTAPPKKKTSEEEQPNQKFPHALYNYQNYATCRNLPPHPFYRWKYATIMPWRGWFFNGFLMASLWSLKVGNYRSVNLALKGIFIPVLSCPSLPLLCLEGNLKHLAWW